MMVTEHVWRTGDGRLVPAGDPDAAFLAYAPGTEISDREAERVGLAAFLKSRGKPLDKSAPKPADKARAFPERK
jgi:hypothetical protein